MSPETVHTSSEAHLETGALSDTQARDTSMVVPPELPPLMARLRRSITPAERVLLYILGVVLGASVLSMLVDLNKAITTVVPAHGGTYTEGIVGTPRFINPLLAISDADRDTAALVYSGLLRATPDGSFIPDLAANYTISDDGKTYTFKIRPGATFHDGSLVTSADVLFTVQAAQNPMLKSPKRADWEGVVASAPDSNTVVFTLPHAYAPFLENTTLGILPKHLWQNVTPEEFPFHTLNTHPVGSGPYMLSSVLAEANGTPTQYTLTSFKKFALGEPYMATFSLSFYPNDDQLLHALKTQKIESVAGIEPSSVKTISDGYTIVKSPLPRVFAVFFNSSQAPVFADASVRKALSVVVDKHAIVDSALLGYGATLNGPIPPGVLLNNTNTASDTASSIPAGDLGIQTQGDRLAAAQTILKKGGWVFATTTQSWTKKIGKNSTSLTFSIATADTPELKATADALVAAWKTLGVTVSVKIFSTSDLNTTVIRPRQYDALLFGEIVGRTLDLFAFWHSSQRNDPGLNLALYANTKADTFLTQARADTNRRAREQDYESFSKIVQDDNAALFLYAPDFIYVVPSSVHGVVLGALTTPSERFLTAYQWYKNTERVWNFFARDAAVE